MATPKRPARVAALIGMLAALAISTLPPPAVAAPPDNDEIGQAARLPLRPHTVRLDTRQATADRATDPDCVGGASVWFRMRAQQSRRVRLNTVGSDYDTVLAVFAGPRRSLTTVRCNVDAAGLASAARVRLEAGRRYFVAVSACCSRAAEGGNLVLNVIGRRPLTASSTVTSTTTGIVSGRAFVTGSQSCSHPAAFEVLATLSQRAGDLVARATAVSFFPLCGSSTPYEVRLDSETGVAFAAGPAVLTLQTFAIDGFTAVPTPEETRVVTLTTVDGRRQQPSRAVAAAAARSVKGER